MLLIPPTLFRLLFFFADLRISEREILAAVKHKNIVTIYDTHEEKTPEGDIFYFIMEYCAGGSLAPYLKNKPMDEGLARFLIVQIIEALLFLEEKNIVHRYNF
jgi:serine/threonine protein kinase